MSNEQEETGKKHLNFITLGASITLIPAMFSLWVGFYPAVLLVLVGILLALFFSRAHLGWQVTFFLCAVYGVEIILYVLPIFLGDSLYPLSDEQGRYAMPILSLILWLGPLLWFIGIWRKGARLADPALPGRAAMPEVSQDSAGTVMSDPRQQAADEVLRLLKKRWVYIVGVILSFISVTFYRPPFGTVSLLALFFTLVIRRASFAWQIIFFVLHALVVNQVSIYEVFNPFKSAVPPYAFYSLFMLWIGPFVWLIGIMMYLFGMRKPSCK